MTTLCNLEHSIFSVIGNTTRRNILRLIACEDNYGNQIASILDVSRPTVHRHLKALTDTPKSYVREREKTKESFSGYRGGEASIYKLDRKITLFLSLMPTYVHSHILELDENGELTDHGEENEGEKLENMKLYAPPNNSSNDSVKDYNKQYSELQEINTEIVALEKKLKEKFLEKNEIMHDLDELLANSGFNFKQRTILRAISCLGPDCLSDLPRIMNEHPVVVEHSIKNLVGKGWLSELEESL